MGDHESFVTAQERTSEKPEKAKFVNEGKREVQTPWKAKFPTLMEGTNAVKKGYERKKYRQCGSV
jgi:hypothetical protein